MLPERAERDLTEDVGGEPLLSVLLLESLLPVRGGELEEALGGPGWQQAEEVSEVGERLESVELAAGQEGDEGGVHFAGFVGAQEEPIAQVMRS
jgi:hypothetical protein